MPESVRPPNLTPLIVVGMHRSGTSLGASLLESAGVDLGTQLVQGNWSNPRGHFEDLDFVQLHRTGLLEQDCDPDGWAAEGLHDVSSAWLDAAHSLVRARAEQRRPWGWKDPRTTLFLPQWSRIVPDARYLFIYRAPWEVVDSLFRRGDAAFARDPEAAFRYWDFYNRTLQGAAQREPRRWLIANTATIATRPVQWVTAVAEKLGLPLSPPESSRVDSTLLHGSLARERRDTVEEFFPEVAELFRVLESNAWYPDDLERPALTTGSRDQEQRRTTAIRDWQNTGMLAFEHEKWRVEANVGWVEGAMAVSPPRPGMAVEPLRIVVGSVGQLLVVTLSADTPVPEHIELSGGDGVDPIPLGSTSHSEILSVVDDHGRTRAARLLLVWLDERLFASLRAHVRPPVLLFRRSGQADVRLDLRAAPNAGPVCPTIDYASTLARTARKIPGLGDDEIGLLADAVSHRVRSGLPLQQSAVADFVGLHAESAIFVRESGIYVRGWMLPIQAELERCRVLCPETGGIEDVTSRLVRARRPDVREAYEQHLHRTPADEFGFCAFVPSAPKGRSQSHHLVFALTRRGDVERVMQPVRVVRPESFRQGVEVVLSDLNPLSDDFERLMGDAVGPALDGLWQQERAKQRRTVVVHAYGPEPQEPRATLLVPVFGRCDLVKHQLAQFANDPEFSSGSFELVYFVDDPRIIDETKRLCSGLWPLYRVPTKVAYTGDNHGFAGANNLAATVARSETLVLMNSDVIPKRPGWAGAVVRAHAALPDCGVLGVKLLYPDGSLQHGGMIFEEFPLWGGLHGNNHPGKGLPSTDETGVGPRPVEAVTGAFMVVSRRLYADLGGLSEDYVIGDFEDSDFCLKVASIGKRVYYLPSVELFHLERQSQSLPAEASSFRTQLTVYNAWVQHRKWSRVLHDRRRAGDDWGASGGGAPVENVVTTDAHPHR